MRIALIGQAAFGADVLKGLIKQGQEVVGVFCPPDRGSKTRPPQGRGPGGQHPGLSTAPHEGPPGL